MNEALLGGTLIGLAAVWLRLATGRIAGISGLLGQAMNSRRAVPWLFLLGLALGGWLVRWLTTGTPLTQGVDADNLAWGTLITGGLLVGVGTRLGSGCTSGHGVCGMARLSPRSIVATLTFMAVGMAMATLPGWLS